MSLPLGIERERLAGLADGLDGVLADLADRSAIDRLWSIDHTLWNDDPTEISDRLGWLSVIDEMEADAARIDGLAAAAVADGFERVVVMGMGGSSLFPEVLASTARGGGRPRSGMELVVLDSTDPAAVGAVAADDLARTLFVASSKSGSTIETRSHLDYFWTLVGAADQFVAITDPGSDLEAFGQDNGFRAVIRNRSDIGGRYAALSHFGMVPAALGGFDWKAMVERARSTAPALRSSDPGVNAALRLGAAMGAAVREGRDKLTLVIDPALGSFGLWLEQLIAESTGKAGTGVVPVVGEDLGPVEVYGSDRMFVALGDQVHPAALDALAEAGHPVVELAVADLSDLGTQVLLWEVATAVCGAVLGVNPFDQPNVAEAKAATSAVLGRPASERTSASPGDPAAMLEALGSGDYLSIQAFVAPDDPAVALIEQARLRLRDRYRVATTMGLGPRFLHSTGQLHKGGPPTGVFLQVVGEDPTDLDIPGRDFTFSELKWAQADGDLATLRRHGLRAERVTVETLRAAGRAPA